MQILCLGLNHHTSPVSLREKLILNEAQIHSIFERLDLNGSAQDIETVILSTCNRVELYIGTDHMTFHCLESLLAEVCAVPLAEISPHLYRLRNEKAVRHLFEVTAGLDSLVLGEPQILGQVQRAFELAQSKHRVGTLLTKLFQSAIQLGKRARTETFICRNSISVSSLAANLCEKSVDDIRSAQIAILGAGEMAELAVEALRKRGAEKILVINRTQARAQLLAERWGSEIAALDQLQNAITRADILLTSTGAAHNLIHQDMVAAAMEKRPDRPLVIIDIAVPRNVDPIVGQIDQVNLFDIDHLNAHLESSLAEREAEVPHVRAIILEEEERFSEFIKTIDIIPLIANLRKQAEIIRQAELKRTLRRLPDLTESERSRIEAMTQALVKKLLETPTRRLRAEASCPQASEYANVARNLFGLPDDAPSSSPASQPNLNSIAAD